MIDSTKLIDFHAHILPGADHGCASSSVCKKQLRGAQKAGVGSIVAVSHFYPHLHNVKDFIRRRDRAYEVLSENAHLYGIEVFKGAEVQLCIGLDRLPGIEELCIADTDVMLVEIPDMPITDEMYDTLSALSERFRVVIAHADRYRESVTKRLIADGYMLQLNAESLFGIHSRRRAKGILGSGLVYAVGSDVHSSRRAPWYFMMRLSKALGEHFDIINKRMHHLLGR